MAASLELPVIILCGGRGTRIREADTRVPKPMLPIGGRPILWHIMKVFATQGQTNFVLALGYLASVVKEFFLHYEALTRDFTIEIGRASDIEFLGQQPERGWRVSCVDTGLDARTGTRVRRSTRHLPDGPVMVTYGDGVANIDLDALFSFHQSHGKLCTVTAVHPPGRFGELDIASDGEVTSFQEKPQSGAGAINGGFMIFEREAIERYIPADDDVMLEEEPLRKLTADGELMAFRHDGYWQSMDTPRERDVLEQQWASGQAPWKIWE